MSESAFDFWNRIQSMMGLVSKSAGILFYSFLQPMNIPMKEKSLDEKVQFEIESSRVGAEDFRKKSNEKGTYINLMDMFYHKGNCYVDMCHYTAQAADEIADRVLAIIISGVQACMKKNQSRISERNK